MNQPLVRTFPVQAPVPNLQDNSGDLDRLKKQVGRCLESEQPVVPFRHLARIAQNFRQAHFAGAAVVNHLPHCYELVDFLPSPPAVLPAMALDLGTTHLEASLLDLQTGDTLAQGTEVNAQAVHGADILSRMQFATRSGKDQIDGLTTLHRQVIEGINSLADMLAKQAGIRTEDIRALTVAGNTTMMHFLLKLNPYHLCREPYIPVVNAPDPATADELNIAIHPAAPVWLLPNISSYFGGDLIAGVLATGLDTAEKPCMLIDVGTNAEVLVGNRDWLIACAGAAGPALEGGVVEAGMRAGPGAIEHVEIQPETGIITYRTVDGGPPRGLCGSGIIDLMAGLYLARIIDIRGKFTTAATASPLQDHLISHRNGTAFVVVAPEEGADSRPVLLTQADLDALMRSKAAMYAILTTLINQVGLSFQELETIYVAGAFGKHISPRQAIVLGMLPDLPLAVYQPVGNSSLNGAATLLLDKSARERAYEVAKKITYIELNVNQEFMIRFSGSRFIPHTDHTLFPTVPYYGGP
jgi:uncharacterized 2Fe-2S/4Fe-4S cluster protein (DUF4445 family)